MRLGTFISLRTREVENHSMASCLAFVPYDVLSIQKRKVGALRIATSCQRNALSDIDPDVFSAMMFK